MTTFYLGTHRPYWLRQMSVPLFISASTVGGYAPVDIVGAGGGRNQDLWPMLTRIDGDGGPSWVGAGEWAFDSGAYMANNPFGGVNYNHPWHDDPDTFGGMVCRIIDSIGIPPHFAAPQDWPVEEGVRAITGYSVYVHQVLTLENFMHLFREFGMVPWAPVLQGWTPHEYIRHIEMYEREGIDLSSFDRVGLGSVCRRGKIREIVTLVQAVQAYAVQRYGRRLRLHGFGMELRALMKVAHLLTSSDSLAWSWQARNEHIRLPECTHRSEFCNNCPDFALAWYHKVRAAMDSPKQLDLELIA